MRVIKDIPVNAVQMDRIPLNSKVFVYAQAMFRGDIFPPIRVKMLPQGSYRILDGRHRWTAARLISKGKIRARFAEIA